MDLNMWSSAAQLAESVVRAVVVYLVAYTAVRLAGRRTVTQMSAFDILVTIALGTLVASTALPSDAAVSDGVAVLVTLLVLQVSIGALRQRLPAIQRVTDFRPYVVMRDGMPQPSKNPLTAQLTPSDLDAVLRQLGLPHRSDARLVVLEPTGKISVLTSDDEQRPTSLFDQFRSG